jgi:hypothetical protein
MMVAAPISMAPACEPMPHGERTASMTHASPTVISSF